MATLTPEQRELAALGASFASHCVPCIKFHVRKARETGLSNDAIVEAMDMAGMVQKMATDRVRKAGESALQAGEEDQPATPDSPCDCNDRASESMDGERVACCGPAFAAAARRLYGDPESGS